MPTGIASLLLALALQAPATPVTVVVDPGADRRAISPLIYGVNFGDSAQAAALHWPSRRWGGNGTTRYSWQDDIANHASDWFFYNIESQPDPGTLPDGSTADIFVDENRAAGGETHPHGAAHRLDADGSGPALGLLGREVRRAAADRVHGDRVSGLVPARRRQRESSRRLAHHRQRSRTTRRARSAPTSSRAGCSTSPAASGRRARAACGSSRSTTSPTSGTRPIATSIRRRSPTTRSGSGPSTTPRPSRRRIRRRSSSDRCPGAGARTSGPLSTAAATAARTSRRTAACTTSSGTCSRPTTTRRRTACASWTTSTSTTTRRRRASR